jgi:DNA-binding transcriptional regulator YiaG
MASPDKAASARTVDQPLAGMISTSLDPAATADITEADLFRGGRLGMGWSQTALARTLLVEEEMLQEWESGARPIPANILEWVGMYVRSYYEPSHEAMVAVY